MWQIQSRFAETVPFIKLQNKIKQKWDPWAKEINRAKYSDSKEDWGNLLRWLKR